MIEHASIEAVKTAVTAKCGSFYKLAGKQTNENKYYGEKKTGKTSLTLIVRISSEIVLPSK